MKTFTELVENYNRNYAIEEEWKLSDIKNRSKLLEDFLERNHVE